MADGITSNQHPRLRWETPIRIAEFNYFREVKRGIYIWGFTVEDQFTPYYVGIADNIFSRIYRHVGCILSGEYTIYHRNSLLTFWNHKHEVAQADKAQGKLYKPDPSTGIKLFLNKRKTLQPHIDAMVDAFSFTYAVVGNDISGGDLKEIEKIVIGQIGIKKLANTRMGDSKKFLIAHDGYSSFFTAK